MNSFGKKIKKKSCLYIIFIVSLSLVIWFDVTGCSQKKPSQDYAAKVLVLDDCDDDNHLQTPPGGDRVLMLDPNGELLKTISGLQVKTRFGENAPIAISQDGRFFAVCENAGKKTAIFETSTGREYWSIPWPDKTMSSTFFLNDALYVTNQTIVKAIDISKKSVKKEDYFLSGTWFDTVFDKKHNCLWTAGSVIEKYSKDFEFLFEVDPVFDKKISGAFSIDAASDGSVWVAVREVVEQNGIGNKLLKISPEGTVTKAIQLEICPCCLCVDQSDDSVWVTGMTSSKDYSKVGDEWPETLTELKEVIATNVKVYTHKYDFKGDRIVELDKGGYSIAGDPFDKSVWIAGRDSVIHISSTGYLISEYKDVSKQHKWIALVK